MAGAAKKEARPLPKNDRFTVFVMGGIFLTVGLIAPAIVMAKSLRGYLRTKAEVSVEARIQSLKRVGSRKRHETEVQYSYRFSGKDYTFSGTEVALFRESGDLYSRLSLAHDAGRPIRVWIDPEKPSFTVIERGWNWPRMLTAVVACGVFSAAGGYLIRCARRGIAPELNR